MRKDRGDPKLTGQTRFGSAGGNGLSPGGAPGGGQRGEGPLAGLGVDASKFTEFGGSSCGNGWLFGRPIFTVIPPPTLQRLVRGQRRSARTDAARTARFSQSLRPFRGKLCHFEPV